MVWLQPTIQLVPMIIRETDTRYTNAELVKRLLEHLRKDGYLVIVDAATGSWYVFNEKSFNAELEKNANQPIPIPSPVPVM